MTSDFENVTDYFFYQNQFGKLVRNFIKIITLFVLQNCRAKHAYIVDLSNNFTPVPSFKLTLACFW